MHRDVSLQNLLVTYSGVTKEVVPGFDPALDAIVRRALARNLEKRFPSAGARLVALVGPLGVGKS